MIPGKRSRHPIFKRPSCITTAVNNSYEIANKYVEEKRNKIESDIRETFHVKISAINDEKSKVKTAIEVDISGNENEVWETVKEITTEIDEILDLN